MHFRDFFVVVSIIGAIANPLPDATGAPRYNIIALDVLPGGLDSYATGISESGVVVGHSTLNRSGNVGSSRPVIWDASGQPTELWPESGVNAPGAIPAGINNAGQVVGRYGAPSSEIPLPGPGIRPGRAFIWDEVNGMRDLGSLGGGRAEATAINEMGQVVGGSLLAGTGAEPFLWDTTHGMQGLGSLGGILGSATAINNLGQVAGTSFLPDFSERAFIWDRVGGMQEFESVSGSTTRSYGINEIGEVVGIDKGSRTDPGGLVVWTFENTTFIPVESGTTLLPSDVNSSGDIVGYIGTPEDVNPEAFIWQADTGFVNLETLLPQGHWDLEWATAINDRGQIVGYGLLDDEIRGFLLIPVPEPSAFASAFIALLLAGARIIVPGMRRRTR